MNFYRWAMRRGAAILFTASLIIFVVSFANSFFLSGAALNQTISMAGYTNSAFVIFIGSIASAVGNCVWPFLGACLLYRLDHYWGGTVEVAK